MPSILSDLQTRFDLPGILRFNAGNGGLIRAVITSPMGEAEIYLHGAHVPRYQPTGAQPILWLSRESVFRADKAIRGGVPICFPWFGARAGHPESPIHGFARLSEWRVESTMQALDGVVEIVLSLDADDQT